MRIFAEMDKKKKKKKRNEKKKPKKEEKMRADGLQFSRDEILELSLSANRC